MIITGDDAPEKKPTGAPKIIVNEGFEKRTDAEPSADAAGLKTDESWKEKAQREKEKLADAAARRQQDELDRQLPPASFLGLVEDLAVRAMFALGQLRDPSTQEAYIDIEGAKYVIELLGVLEQKTKGNLDANEEQALKSVMHNLRMAFVQVSRAAAAAIAAEMQKGSAPGAPQRGAPGAGPAAPGPGPGPGPGKPGPKIIY